MNLKESGEFDNFNTISKASKKLKYRAGNSMNRSRSRPNPGQSSASKSKSKQERIDKRRDFYGKSSQDPTEENLSNVANMRG